MKSDLSNTTATCSCVGKSNFKVKAAAITMSKAGKNEFGVQLLAKEFKGMSVS